MRANAEVDEWAPFKDEEEWELFRWLIKHVGQNRIDEFLKLSIVRTAFGLPGLTARLTTYQIRRKCGLSADSKYKFFQHIDDLPRGTPWQCDIIAVEGDRMGDDGKLMHEDLELWRCDPVGCTEELIGNPGFDGNIAYAPERVYADEGATIRRYDEMWTAEWWWRMQVSIQKHSVLPRVYLT